MIDSVIVPDDHHQIATRRKINFDTFNVTYVCGSCQQDVECSLSSAVMRKDIGQYCADTRAMAMMLVKLNTLPQLDRDFWKEKVNLSAYY
tara:strand:+ start:186 stop:455 length:270 start_codon:yes stop_codon:yes gene_type:complete